MKIWLERFVLGVLATVSVATVLSNPWDLTRPQQVGLVAGILVTSLIVAVVAERVLGKSQAGASGEIHANQSDGAGGEGGGGSAIGKRSTVIGGKGGRGGDPGMGRGGAGGGGDAIGDGSMVIGGDGGDGGRSDGRGGRGAPSPLKKMPPEMLRSWGLTGDEGYGQGGSAPNSPEYDRSLKVLCGLSAEYIAANPAVPLKAMPGVLMPPVEWVNTRLTELGETFRVDLIDAGADFRLRRLLER